MSAMMSIYQGDGTRDVVPSVFIGVDEDRSDRLRVAFGEDPQTSRAVAEFVVRSLLSYSRP